MILRTGLTGGIASGKSTIARMFRDLGCFVIDADDLVAQLYRPGAAGHTALVQAYGAAVLRPDGEIDRVALADRAFQSVDGTATLNQLIHPLVMDEAERIVRQEELRGARGDFIAMVEATLLLEAGGRARYDRIVVVDVDAETQISRGIARGMTRVEVERRIAHQMTREERLRDADYVIDNRGTLDDASAAAQAVYERLVEDLTAKRRAARS